MNGELEQWQFRCLAEGGFGDRLNAYAHSMGWFKNRLYVGTTRANLHLLKRRAAFPVTCWPVRCPDQLFDLDLRAQIWQWNPDTGEWRQVRRSPTVEDAEIGRRIPQEVGYRAMTVFQGTSDPEPALYVAPWAPARAATPSLLLRSLDGEEFVPLRVTGPGLDDAPTASFRSLVSFKGRLFLSPTSRPGSTNIADSAVVLETADPARESWRAASAPGFGDPSNRTVFEMAVFADHLYAGTMNPEAGFQVWKTRAEGDPPHLWECVLREGAYRGVLNECALSMVAFAGALYVGTGIQNGGYDLTHQIGPASPELLRIHPDDSWDLLVGQARRTPDGPAWPLSGFGPGFDSLGAGYFWRMAELAGVLYLGTFDWRTMLPYLRESMLGRGGDARLARWLGPDRLARFGGGFDLHRTTDGVHWVQVSGDGLGNPYNYGARTLLGTPHGLFVGTANPFGPEIAMKAPDGWRYAPNPRGGAEIWLGALPEVTPPAGRERTAAAFPSVGVAGGIR